MARPPQREALEPTEDVPSIVATIEALGEVGERRQARLRLREDALVYRLKAKRLRRNERLADSVAKFVGGSLLTTTVAVVLGGHGGGPVFVLVGLTLLLFAFGTIWASAAEYDAAAWDNEADRVAAALEELGGGTNDVAR